MNKRIFNLTVSGDWINKLQSIKFISEKVPSENNLREGFLKSSYIKRKGKKCNGRDISVLTPSANNKRDCCTGFVIFLLFIGL